MTKYRIIGNMTGNSMDAIDLVMTEFDDNIMSDICSYTKPYSKDMQDKIENLRTKVFGKTYLEIEALPDFFSIHNEYISQIAECIDEMCKQNNIDKSTVDAIGFHGKTLDHNPPSKACIEKTLPYTLQIGSGQMLADLTGIPVVYDFRSDFIMAGFDGAPLIAPHNAKISKTEKDGCYYNGGNTSNFALINNGVCLISTDAGPFNEYTDNYIRNNTNEAFDKDGMFGKKGILDKQLLQELFNLGRMYYETPLPKSGDPAYYCKKQIFKYIEQKKLNFENCVYTFEYFAAYIAVYTLSLIPDNIKIPENFILFGGGWKNPIVKECFEQLLNQKGYILPEHQEQFVGLQKKFQKKTYIRVSEFGDYMEARLFADLAYHKLNNKSWDIPEVIKSKKSIICGCIAKPDNTRIKYSDYINRAAKGWQQK